MREVKSPMLASEYDPSKLKFPVIASPKIDGIRGHVVNGVIYSRSAKPIRNRHIQALLGNPLLDCFDGELVFGPANAPNVYSESSKGVMSFSGHPVMGTHDFDFWVFDCYAEPDNQYEERIARVRHYLFDRLYPHPEYIPNIKVLPQTVLCDESQLDIYEAEQLALGYEGVMLRDPLAPYKFGRSSVRDGALLKVKRFAYDEARIVGHEELMHNDNELTQDELGRARRSESKDGKRPSGMLGAYICVSPKYQKDGRSIEFNVSCGSMSHEERKSAWDNRVSSLNKLVRFRHLPHGAKDVPRHGLYAGFRDPDDL